MVRINDTLAIALWILTKEQLGLSPDSCSRTMGIRKTFVRDALVSRSSVDMLSGLMKGISKHRENYVLENPH